MSSDASGDSRKLAAKRAVRDAEAHFQRKCFHLAVQSMKAAKDMDPELSCMADNYMAAYNVVRAARARRSLYEVLGVEDVRASGCEIKKRYKKMSLMVHPDKNGSAAAEEAFKHVSNAMEVLSDETKRLAYDCKMGYVTSPQPHCPQQRPASWDWVRTQQPHHQEPAESRIPEPDVWWWWYGPQQHHHQEPAESRIPDVWLWWYGTQQHHHQQPARSRTPQQHQ
uniref:J domain-containing protein n=1 Tax=Kalanchoe fedtschenkoi TaxID=63787 RepID=A0A7N0TJ41_KALFE